MKKLSIALLALAIAVVFAVPAMAGDISVSGTYSLDGESDKTNSGTKVDFFDDDLDLKVKVTKGDVTGYVKLEVSDNGSFDGSNVTRGGSATVNDIVDDFYVKWQATDAMTFKAGQYSYTFGEAIGADFGYHNIELGYGLENVDLGLMIMKKDETKTDPETDQDVMVVTIGAKGLDPIKKLGLAYITLDNQAADTKDTYIGLETGFDLGPVGLDFEYGTVSSDGANDGGNYMWADIGLGDLIGVDLGLELLRTNEDWASSFSDDYGPLVIYSDKVNGGESHVTLYIAKISHKVTDKLKLALKAGSGTEGSGMGDGSVGTEFDVIATYSLADNVTYYAKYASWSPGDAYTADDTYTVMFHRIKFAF